MKPEVFRVFLESAVSVIEEMTGSRAGIGRILCERAPLPLRAADTASAVGMTGEIEGWVLIELDTGTARSIASRMGRPQDGSDSTLVSSTINELANIISGRAVSALMDQGLRLAITPPMSPAGGETDGSDTPFDLMHIPLDIEAGTVMLTIACR